MAAVAEPSRSPAVALPRVALLSNVTLDVLAGMLRKTYDLWLPPGFGAWMETALNVPDDLRNFDPEAVFLLLDASHAAYEPASVAAAVSALEAALPRTTVLVLDLEDLFSSSSSDPTLRDFFDERLWQLASMPWSLAGLHAIRDEIGRLFRAMRGARRKVLALDFDGTLWRGVIGEDGLSGIEPFAAFQRAVKTLQARGVLLVGLSKNNAADVEPVWDDPRMVLRREDFVDMRIDWNDKGRNLEDVARRLNLGTEAFVFLDDNPAERARMAAAHPEVAVPDWPVSARRLSRLYFPRLRVTDEDRRKTACYRDEAKRRELSRTLSFEDYLKDLDIRTEIHPIVPEEFTRVAQLSQKANQFNVCTNRHTEEAVARFAADPTHLVVTLHAADRFGDLGLVAFVHVAAASAEPGIYAIVDWVMSCRAMNRRIEDALQRWVEAELLRRGATALRATWRRTERNAPVCALFEKFGFTVVSETEGEKRYERRLTDPVSAQTEVRTSNGTRSVV